MEQFSFADKKEQVKMINRYVSFSMLIFDALILLVVTISVMQGNRTALYETIMVLIMVVTSLTCFVLLKKEPSNDKLRYVAFVGMFFIMLMIAFAYNDYYMRFMITVPFLGTVLYFDKKYSQICAFGIAVPDTAIFLYRAFVINGYRDGEFLEQLGATVVVAVIMFVLLYMSTVGKRFSDDSIGKINAEAQLQQEMLNDLVGIASQIREGTEQAMELIDNLKSSSEVVKQSVGDISESTSVTAESMQVQNLMTQSIQENIDHAVTRSAHMVHIAEESSKLNRSNAQKMKELKAHADVLADTNYHVAESMKQLQENVSEVRNITQTIFAISSQTNLLALNASIEAARAGELGKGFAVVADEIRNLSESTRRETENIATILDKLTTNANQTAEAVEKTVSVSDVQDEMIKEVADKVDELTTNVEGLVEDVAQIDKMIENLSEANAQIVDDIVQISATTEEITACSQQASALTENNFTNAVNAHETLSNVILVSHRMDKYINE